MHLATMYTILQVLFVKIMTNLQLTESLPKIDMGDYLIIHDTGAHGFSMGYNYNGKLRSSELLLKEDGSVEMIRRAETPKDYLQHLIL